jgi:hypothetical protein
MPVFTVSENTSLHSGFSRKRRMRPALSVMTTPYSRGLSTLVRQRVARERRSAADDQKRVVAQEVLRLLDTAGGAERGVLHRVFEVNTELAAVTEVLLDLLGHVVERHDDIADSVARQQLQNMLHHGLVHDGDERFRPVKRQGSQAAALTACHDDCFHYANLRCGPRGSLG